MKPRLFILRLLMKVRQKKFWFILNDLQKMDLTQPAVNCLLILGYSEKGIRIRRSVFLSNFCKVMLI